MTKELDRGVLTRDIPGSGLTVGDVGTVVHRYEQPRGYEVEFAAGDGSTVAVLTVGAADLRPLEEGDMLHVRKRTPV